MSFRNLLLQIPAMKHYFIAAGFIFGIGIYLGYASPERFQYILDASQDRIKDIAESIHQSDHPTLKMFSVIWVNNFIAVLATIGLGAFFMVMPVYFLLTNGALIGYLAGAYVQNHATGTFLRGILPHGVIEIPAVLMASAFGIRFGILIAKTLIQFPYQNLRAKRKAELSSFLKGMIPLVIILAFLLFVAAVLESIVTPWIVGK